ncbi:MAG: hypothetical protein ABTQ32_25625 [Myxococcaceae bacterium]
MRIIEARGPAGTVAFAVVPLPANVADSMGVTQAALFNASLFGYTALFVVNHDQIRGWAGTRATSQVPLVSLDTASVFRPYGGTEDVLREAGESVLSGLVERWLADLNDHWRHPAGKVPGEVELRSAGVPVAFTTIELQSAA